MDAWQPIGVDFNDAIPLDGAWNQMAVDLNLRHGGDVDRAEIELHEGMILRLFDWDEEDDGSIDNLVVDGRAHFDSVRATWTAIVNGSEIKHVSEILDASHWSRSVDWRTM